ncbi:MAG: hypothetical protein OXC54_08840, partial [Rhodospirillaceae bacterium]|nr:hypothetical protein [Rhodospirillaceae bacterium]
VTFDADGPIVLPDPKSLFLDSLDGVNELKKAVRPYTGAEKEGIHAFVSRDKNLDVVDLEIAIDDGKGRKQIDLAAIHEDIDRPGSFKLVFYEAKHFGNGDLRAKTGKIPVVAQMSRYSEAIAQNHDELVDSYRKVCGNLSELEGVVQQDRKKRLQDIASRSVELLIEDQPRLIVFGFDQDQRDGSIWGPHAKRLEDELTKERILFVGTPKSIGLGGR